MERGGVQRFTPTARLVHWSFAALFLWLLASGLALSVPALSVAVGHRAALRTTHILAGIALLSVPAAIALIGDRRSVLADAREVDTFTADDWRFLTRRPSRPGRFNGGQKLNTLVTVTAAVLLLASGLVMWQWPDFPRTWRHGAIAVHELLTWLMVPVVLGHVYLSALHPSTRPGLRGMLGGRVDARWAQAHHPGWDALQVVSRPLSPPEP
jgi:formate dehydrogenase subunit gamma